MGRIPGPVFGILGTSVVFSGLSRGAPLRPFGKKSRCKGAKTFESRAAVKAWGLPFQDFQELHYIKAILDVA